MRLPCPPELPFLTGTSYVSNICTASIAEMTTLRAADADEPSGYSQHVVVFTQYDVVRKHPDYLNPPGPEAWDFGLGRNSIDRPWRIISRGLG